MKLTELIMLIDHRTGIIKADVSIRQSESTNYGLCVVFIVE